MGVLVFYRRPQRAALGIASYLSGLVLAMAPLALAIRLWAGRRYSEYETYGRERVARLQGLTV